MIETTFPVMGFFTELVVIEENEIRAIVPAASKTNIIATIKGFIFSLFSFLFFCFSPFLLVFSSAFFSFISLFFYFPSSFLASIMCLLCEMTFGLLQTCQSRCSIYSRFLFS